jgi:hypothetical protein
MSGLLRCMLSLMLHGAKVMISFYRFYLDGSFDLKAGAPESCKYPELGVRLCV